MRHILLVCALASFAWAAPAAGADPQTWRFSYTGFYVTATQADLWEHTEQTTQGFRPELALSGSFSGTDADGDGTIGLSELSALDFNGIDYYACAASPSPYGRCTIADFRYALTGQLTLSASYAGNDEFYSSWNSAVLSGVRASSGSYRRYTEDYATYDWTPQTRFSISPAPVPEPAGPVLAAGGILVLGALGRRQRC